MLRQRPDLRLGLIARHARGFELLDVGQRVDRHSSLPRVARLPLRDAINLGHRRDQWTTRSSANRIAFISPTMPSVMPKNLHDRSYFSSAMPVFNSAMSSLVARFAMSVPVTRSDNTCCANAVLGL